MALDYAKEAKFKIKTERANKKQKSHNDINEIIQSLKLTVRKFNK